MKESEIMRMPKISKKIRILVGIMMMMIILLCCSGQVQAAQSEDYSASTYLSLGDSIAYGMSATVGRDYADLLYNHLLTTTTYSSLSLNNLAVSGDTSSNLLTRLQTAPYIAAVENAKVITLSIGGDNLLSPVIGAVATAFGVNPANNPNLMTDLAVAMAANPNKDAILAGIANTPSLAQALQSGVSQFSADFPQIIGTLKTLSPQAQICVLNLYNPFNSQDPLYTVFDPLINGINQGIRNNAVAGYEVADVYTKFKTIPGVVNFNLATIQLDPHPTTVGHAAIYQAILDAESVQIPAPVKMADGDIADTKTSTIYHATDYNSNTQTYNTMIDQIIEGTTNQFTYYYGGNPFGFDDYSAAVTKLISAGETPAQAKADAAKQL
jgi:lysophospholipase L1-like esterase